MTAQQFRLIGTAVFLFDKDIFQQVFSRRGETMPDHLWEKFLECDRDLMVFLQGLDDVNLSLIYYWMLDKASECDSTILLGAR